MTKVTDLVGHLRWRVGAPAEGELLATDLAADPDHLAGAVADTAAGRGSDDTQVLGSLWWQAYAYRVAGTTAACWVLGGAAPDPSADAGTAVGIARSRPSSVIYGADAPAVPDLRQADRAALRRPPGPGGGQPPGPPRPRRAAHLGRRRRRHRLRPVRRRHRRTPAEASLRERADELIDALPHGIRTMGRWDPESWSFRRRTCCLWWKTTVAGGKLCEDCSLR